jgi:hypothetical protein
MKLTKLLILLALVASHPAIAGWDSNRIYSAKEMSVVPPLCGATRIYRPEQLYTNSPAHSISATNHFLLWDGTEWCRFYGKSVLAWNDFTSSSNRIQIFPVDTEQIRVTFADTADGPFTNVQFGAVLTRIPAAKAALIGSGFGTELGVQVGVIFAYQKPLIHFTPENGETPAQVDCEFSTNWDCALPHAMRVGSYRPSDSNWCCVTFDRNGTITGTNGIWTPGGGSGFPFYPGNGAMFFNPLEEELKIWMMGTCFSGSVTSSIPTGWSALCPPNGDGGSLLGLGFPYDTNTVVKRWNPPTATWTEYHATNTISTNLPPPRYNTLWGTNEPCLNPGEAFMCYQASAKTWVMQGAQAPDFVNVTNANFAVKVIGATPSTYTVALLNVTNGNAYVVESRSNVNSGTWVKQVTNTPSSNTLYYPLSPLDRLNRSNIFLRARIQP